MVLTKKIKDDLIKELVSYLSSDKEIKRIIIFGSFIKSMKPNDLDVAVFQKSNKSYLPLAIKYRKRIRPLLRKIPVDIFQLKFGVQAESLFSEINSGKVIYER